MHDDAARRLSAPDRHECVQGQSYERLAFIDQPTTLRAYRNRLILLAPLKDEALDIPGDLIEGRLALPKILFDGDPSLLSKKPNKTS